MAKSLNKSNCQIQRQYFQSNDESTALERDSIFVQYRFAITDYQGLIGTVERLFLGDPSTSLSE